MSRLLHAIVTLVWGLWFGGMVMLFFVLNSLFFDTFKDRRDLAGQAGSGIFHFLSYYHLTLAAVALVATFAWRMVRASRLNTLLFVLFALATVSAVYSSAVLTPGIEKLRVEGLTQSDAFKRLHAQSMLLFLAETGIVLIAGLLLPGMGGPARQRTQVTSDSLQTGAV